MSFPHDAQLVLKDWVGVPRKHMEAILHNIFDPLNLCKLRRGMEIQKDDDDQEFYLRDGTIALKRLKEKYKNFGKTSAILVPGILGLPGPTRRPSSHPPPISSSREVCQ